MNGTKLYNRLGRHEGIRAIVDEFYDRLCEDEELGPFFEDADMEKLRRAQTDFLCEEAGGPEIYDAAPVGKAHREVPFTPAHIQRAIDILYRSLDECDVPEEDAEKVVQAVAGYEESLLASSDDGA